MKNYKILHTIISTLVLCCYFTAMTPIHSIWHYVEKEIVSHSEKDNSQHECEHQDTEVSNHCHFCDIIFSGEINYTFTPTLFLDFYTYLFSTTENILYQDIFYTSSLNRYSSLRAPPFYC
ncbi:MAG: hypothetical protein Q3983_08610 [Capnocytophaga sp.]|nr:hypothetical protein [Capnocytophaga sp.]